MRPKEAKKTGEMDLGGRCPEIRTDQYQPEDEGMEQLDEKQK